MPSGTKWASQNVGARKPSDYGFYFQWGDTVGYTAEQVGKDKRFSWDDYKWSIDGSDSNFSKYNETDNKTVLELEDDAAHVNMGGSWHMPSPTQISELLSNTTNTWTTSDDGVNGRLFTSKKDGTKSIFFPVAGNAWDGSVYDRGDYGDVWSSMLSSSDVSSGQYLGFGSGDVGLYGDDRYGGRSVRGVLG